MIAQIAEAFRTVVLILAALLPIINPIGTAPIFLSMTRGASDEIRAALARRVARDSALLLLAAMLTGSYVLSFFGLSLAAVKIAGGLLVTANGWHLLTADDSAESDLKAKAQSWGAEEIAGRGFYPLTFPVTIGPGSVSVAMTLGAGARADTAGILLTFIASFVGLVLVGLAIYLCDRFAPRLLRVLGSTGSVVLLRLSAFILLAIGIQILCDGLAERFGIPTALRG